MRNIKKLFFILSILIFSCSEVKKKDEEIKFGDGNAKWIQDNRKLPKRFITYRGTTMM